MKHPSLRTSFLLVFLTVFFNPLLAQKKIVRTIERQIQRQEAEAHLIFLSSDEMRGRDTGSPELDIAAQYIASYFRQLNIKPAPNADQYFQAVSMQSFTPASSVELKVQDQDFQLKRELVHFAGEDINFSGEIVFAGYGTREDFERAGVNGKIAMTFAGMPGENNIMKAFTADAAAKNHLAKEHGALALIEIVAFPGIPFEGLVARFHRERKTLKSDVSMLPHLWMKNLEAPAIAALKEARTASGSLKISGGRIKDITSRNVAAIIEGTDPDLKNEYVVVSAHYDHIGVGAKNQAGDSIFNGARDNAIGTVALMETAKFFSQQPPRRSVLLLALTGEEQGLLGSLWYVDHPLIPLQQTVFNANNDGAGYNDKTSVTIVGLNRTSAQADLEKACQAFGLTAALDPVPEQNLYERSDNYSFAAKGIPAIDFAPGIKAFDQELMKYYHNQEDEVSTLDMDYVTQYFRSYVYANFLLGNAKIRYQWKPGDKFEATSKTLYGR